MLGWLVEAAGGAVAGGLAQYWITGGASGWAPLLGPLIGVVGVGGARLTIAMVRGGSPDGGRVPIPATPAELTSEIGSEHTAVAVQHLGARYVGKWLNVAGEVSDVLPGVVGHHGAEVRLWPPLGTGVTLWFPEGSPQVEGVHLLRKGTSVRVVGRIADVSSNMVILEQCELL